MKIDLDRIPDEGVHITLDGTVDLLGDALKKTPAGPDVEVDPFPTGSLDFIEHDPDFYLTATVRAGLTLRCARCLREFPVTRDLEVRLLVRRRDDASIDEEEAAALEGDVAFADEDEFDPGEPILQEIFLNIPMKPLCDEECPGLCPKCGLMRGSEECVCPQEERIDPRWEKLRQLKKDSAP